MPATQLDRDEKIRQLAYKIWQDAGCPNGSDLQHWLKAQEIWLETHGPKKSRTTTSKAGNPKKSRAVKRAL
jgi:hypothetical protein